MPGLSVIIPSRLSGLQPGVPHLESAVRSIRAQMEGEALPLQILVGIDSDAVPPYGLEERLNARFVRSNGHSQAGALNAAAQFIEGDHVAILEDDDLWADGYPKAALAALKNYDFVSSTQLEVTPDGVILRINDFPTPSGWVMRRALWDRIGGFNENFQLHLDNEWLGRLGLTDAKRAHFVEATAPVDVTLISPVRPWLANLVQVGRPSVTLIRHNSPFPLVTRLCHWGSGVERISRTPALKKRSAEEVSMLCSRFGGVPW